MIQDAQYSCFNIGTITRMQPLSNLLSDLMERVSLQRSCAELLWLIQSDCNMLPVCLHLYIRQKLFASPFCLRRIAINQWLWLFGDRLPPTRRPVQLPCIQRVGRPEVWLQQLLPISRWMQKKKINAILSSYFYLSVTKPFMSDCCFFHEIMINSSIALPSADLIPFKFLEWFLFNQRAHT